MRAAPRLLCASLALVLLGASLVPCAPGSADARAPVVGTEHAGGGHPPGCHRVERTQLQAPCPCGCSERASGASPGTRLGLALLSQPARAATVPAFPAVSTLGPHEPPVPVFTIDHVPLD